MPKAMQRVKRITLVLIPASNPGQEEKSRFLPEWKPEPLLRVWWRELPLGFILFVLVLVFLLWLANN